MADLNGNRERRLVCLRWFAAHCRHPGCYWPVCHFGYVNLDDPLYVYQTRMVQRGLSWPGVIWAFQCVEGGNWNPLVWLSHMADCQLYGVTPGGHHVTSLLLHSANVWLLFLVLRRMTGAIWRSGFAAALFAWHPLHVESVAWVSERKDVLSTLFWLLAIWAYARYAEVQSLKPKVQSQESAASRQASGTPATDNGPRTTDHATRYYLISLSFLRAGVDVQANAGDAAICAAPFGLLAVGAALLPTTPPLDYSIAPPDPEEAALSRS